MAAALQRAGVNECAHAMRYDMRMCVVVSEYEVCCVIECIVE